MLKYYDGEQFQYRITDLQCSQVSDMVENGMYKYRVKAFNSIGISDPASCEPILAKNPFGAFF